MAVLSDADRFTIWKVLMQRAECPSIPKVDFRAAVNAIDDYLETNAAAINTALPQPYRGAASTGQKAALMAAVALKRYGRDF